MIASLFMKPAEREALEKLTALIGPLLSRTANPNSVGDAVDEIRGQKPLSGVLGDVVRFVRHVSANPSLLDAGVTFVLAHADKRGIQPEALGSLLRKFAPYLKLDAGSDEDPVATVRSVLTSLASREIETDRRIGAVCICPDCNFTFFV